MYLIFISIEIQNDFEQINCHDEMKSGSWNDNDEDDDEDDVLALPRNLFETRGEERIS